MSEATQKNSGTARTNSIGDEKLTNCMTTVLDAGLDATATALHGVPVLSIFVGLARAGSSIKHELEFRKIVKFLEALDGTSAEKRASFTAKLQEDGKTEEFGQNILLLLERLDDFGAKLGTPYGISDRGLRPGCRSQASASLYLQLSHERCIPRRAPRPFL